MYGEQNLHSVQLTACPLKNGDYETTFLSFWGKPRPIFRGKIALSFGESICSRLKEKDIERCQCVIIQEDSSTKLPPFFNSNMILLMVQMSQTTTWDGAKTL